MTIAQRSPASVAGTLIGEIAIIGTFSSLATATMAIVEGAVAVPISRSTLFSSTSLRALRVAADGSEPSSSWISLIFSAPTLLAIFDGRLHAAIVEHADRRARPALRGDEPDRDLGLRGRRGDDASHKRQ